MNGQVDHAFDECVVVVAQRDGDLSQTLAARECGTRPLEDRVAHDGPRGGRGGGDFFIGRPEDPTVERRDLIDAGHIVLERHGREHGVHERPEPLARWTVGIVRQLDDVDVTARCAVCLLFVDQPRGSIGRALYDHTRGPHVGERLLSTGSPRPIPMQVLLDQGVGRLLR